MGLCWKLELEIAHLFLNFAICLVLEFGGKKRKKKRKENHNYHVWSHVMAPQIFLKTSKKKAHFNFYKTRPHKSTDCSPPTHQLNLICPPFWHFLNVSPKKLKVVLKIKKVSTLSRDTYLLEFYATL